MHKRVILTGALLGVASLITACGGSDGGDGDAKGSVTVVTTAKYDVSTIGAEAGLELKTFGDLPVKVTIAEDATSALASGDADVALASPNRFIGAIQKGLDAKIVGPTLGVWDQYIIARTDVDADTIQDWKGGKIGISSFGSAGDYSAEKVASELGWDKSAYTIVPLGGLDALEAALRSGTIDAFAWSGQSAFALKDEGVAKVLGSVKDIVGPSPLDVLAVSGKMIKDDPDKVKQFCDGYYAAQKKFQDDPSLAESTYRDKWNDEDEALPDILKAGLPTLSTSPDITDDMFANMADATNFTIDGAHVTADDVKGMYVNCDSL